VPELKSGWRGRRGSRIGHLPGWRAATAERPRHRCLVHAHPRRL